MTHFERVIAKMGKIAPLELAEQWDNVGLLVDCLGNKMEQSKVMLTNDYTEQVLQECIEKGVGLVISYHPPLFNPIKRLTSVNPTERLMIRTIQAGISVYSPHTALDCCLNGNNDWLASTFASVGYDIEPIRKHARGDGSGMGRLLRLKQSISPSAAVELIKRKLNLGHVRMTCPWSQDAERIRIIAVCAGAGTSLFKELFDPANPSSFGNVDLFVTGEAGHHFALECQTRGACLVLTEHSNSERGFLRDVLLDELKNESEVLISQVDRDPLQVV